MTYFYSPETKGFYNSDIHGSMPSDVFEISEEHYRTLLEGQSLGKTIVYKSRKLQLVDFVAPPLTWDQIRQTRDSKLAASDWTQMPDTQLSEESKEDWRTYRQVLRDITESFSEPDDVVWPMAPNATPTEE
jgi:hypothetical protein